MKFNSQKVNGYLFIFAALCFFVAAYIGDEATSYGLGAAFLAVGANFLNQDASKSKND